MKKFALCFAALLLFLLPLTASAYYDERMQLALFDSDLPAIYGTLNRRMATRTGPSTEYDEPGTFHQEGDRVRIISIAFDINDVPWVQVDMNRGGKRMRVYTGFKRIDGVNMDDIPREFNYGYDMKLAEDYTPRKGPGDGYAKYGYTLRRGRTVTLVDYENGYAMVDYYADSDGSMNRVWIPQELLE